MTDRSLSYWASRTAGDLRALAERPLADASEDALAPLHEAAHALIVAIDKARGVPIAGKGLGGNPETIAMIAGTLPCTTYHGTDGSSLLLTDEQRYIISVDEEGRTSSGNIVTVHPQAVAEALGADVGDVAGWETGWDC